MKNKIANKLTRYTLFVMMLLQGGLLSAQYIPENFYNPGIEDFIDELSSSGIITVNQSIKPYSRHQISQWLTEATAGKENLTNRQQKELEFYSIAYQIDGRKDPTTDKLNFTKSPLGFQYQDSLFKLSIHPILSGSLYINDSATIQNRFWGGSVYGSVGKHFAFYTVITDHWETQTLASPGYLTQLEGGKYKKPQDNEGGEYSAMRGGLTWAWNWGQAGFIYDRFSWGSGYHGANIFGGRTTSFPQLNLKIAPAKWFEFNYVHAWLNSEVPDTFRTYNIGHGTKNSFIEKYLAATMFSFVPWKFIRLSVGNSVIYSSRNAYPGFIIPVLFYRSVDENYSNINNNSQLFFDLSMRPVKHLHLYSSLFLDDFRLSRIGQAANYNLYSFKAGFRSSSWLVNNLIFTAEYTKTMPIVYKHKIDVITFATNNYSLGHYLRDNSREFFGMIEWKPRRGATLYSAFTFAEHGNEYQYITDQGAVSYPVMKDRIWVNQTLKTGINVEILAGTMLKAAVIYSNITSTDADGQTAQYWLNKFSPSFLQGKHVTLEGGFCIGF
jgi:hypothetical protein